MSVFTQSVLPLQTVLQSASPGARDAQPKYAVVIDAKDHWDLMGFFQGMPDMTAFATAALLSKTGVLARVSKTEAKIDMSPAALK